MRDPVAGTDRLGQLAPKVDQRPRGWMRSPRNSDRASDHLLIGVVEPRLPGQGRRRQAPPTGRALDLGYVQGRRKRVTRYARTEGAAVEESKRLRREHDAGRLVLNGGQMTMADYLDYWLTELLPGTVKPTTEASYADMTRRHIVDGLGHLDVEKLSRDDVRRFIRQLARSKSQRRGDDGVLSARTVHYVHSILRRALEDARREELIGRNVAREVSPPRYERREFEPLAPKRREHC
jgi:hypothetical protein